MEYTKEYFIKKFEAIPEENWVTGPKGFICKNGKACALGFTGVSGEGGIGYTVTEETMALIKLFGGNNFNKDCELVWSVNDGRQKKYKGRSPKRRIINYLKALK